MWRPGRLRRLREYLSNGLFSFSLCAVRDRRRYWAGTEGRYVDQASQVRNRLFAGGRWIRTLRWREMDSNFRFLVTRPSNRHGRRHCFLENGSGSVREPKVRIHLPPAESPSLARVRFRESRTPAFRAGVRGWRGDRVDRDAHGVSISRQPAAISLSDQNPVPQCR